MQGLTMPEIVEAMKKDYPKNPINREKPYELVRKAVDFGWVKFHPPEHLEWSRMLRDEYQWLDDPRVIHTTAAWDVARHGADALVRLIKKACRRTTGKNEVHIGFTGGHAMRALAREFADLLWGPVEGFPRKIVIHAMAAGFDPRDPTMDPNAFFSYFKNGRLNEIEVEFFGLAAPLLVKTEGMSIVREQPGIADAFAAVREIDIIVASGSDWLDKHSALRNLMQRSEESEAVLEKEGVVADIAWRPFGKNGPIETKTSVRALTLVELSDLPGLIEQGKHVLLTLGPCGMCHEPKGRLLDCLLSQKTPFVTNLIVDSRSVAHMIRLRAEAKGR